MKNDALTRFSVDKKKNKINVTRDFKAPLEQVWKAWTDNSLLDQWWAPKPWKARTKSMDFKEGGHWLYAMESPDGDKHWARADFATIKPMNSFSALDAFADENGKIDNSFPKSVWTNRFSGKANTTSVSVEITYEKPEELEKILEMGFTEGFTAGLNNLEELLENQKKISKIKK